MLKFLPYPTVHCESIDLSSEITYYTCRSTHPDAGSFYAVFDGQKLNYFNDANFGDRTLENHAITLDQNGHVHLAYISKTWMTYGSDPLGAGYEVHSVHYAYFNGTSWHAVFDGQKLNYLFCLTLEIAFESSIGWSFPIQQKNVHGGLRVSVRFNWQLKPALKSI